MNRTDLGKNSKVYPTGVFAKSFSAFRRFKYSHTVSVAFLLPAILLAGLFFTPSAQAQSLEISAITGGGSFGPIPPGIGVDSHCYRITATGGAFFDANVRNTDPDFFVSADSPVCAPACTVNGTTLNPGEFCEVEIEFFGELPGDYSATLEAIALDGSSTETVFDTFFVTGIVMPEELTASPPSLSFPDTAPGAMSASQIVTLAEEYTSEAIDNTSMTFTISPATHFSFDGTPECVGVAILVEGCEIGVLFTPQSAGTHTATLSVGYNDGTGTSGNNASLDISLSGTASAPPALTITPLEGGSTGDFAPIFVNEDVGRCFQVTNTGGAATNSVVFSLGGSGVFEFETASTICSGFFGVADCGGTGTNLAPGESCSADVFFGPSSTSGMFTDTLTAMAAGGATATFPISGEIFPPATFEFSDGDFPLTSLSVAENSSAEVFLLRTDDAPIDVFVTVQSQPGTAEQDDFNAILIENASVSANGALTVAIQPVNDNIPLEDGESFSINVTETDGGTAKRSGKSPTPPLAAAVGDVVATLTVDIIDDDTGSGVLVATPPSLTFPDTAAGNSSTSTITLTEMDGTSFIASEDMLISVSPGIHFNIGSTADCNTAGSLVAGCQLDVAFEPQAPGTHTAILTVAYNDGTGPSGTTDNTLDIPLSGTAPGPVIVSFAQTSFSVAEGSDSQPGSLMLTVQLSEAHAQDLLVDIATIDGTADESDYNRFALPLSIPAGSTSVNRNVSFNGDDLFEEDESFTVALSNPRIDVDLGGGTKLSTKHPLLIAAASNGDPELDPSASVATITIVNDDAEPPVLVDFADSSLDVQAVEGSESTPGSATLSLQLSEAHASSINVSFNTIDGTAMVNQDYQPITSVTIPANVTSHSFDVILIGDAETEDPETFSVQLTDASLPSAKKGPIKHPFRIAAASNGDPAIGSNTVASVTIVDDDSTPASITLTALSLSTEFFTTTSGTVTVTNNGSTSASNLSIGSLAAPFSVTGTTCTSSLAGSSSCSVTISYSPDENFVDSVSEDLIVNYLPTPSDEESASANGTVTGTPVKVITRGDFRIAPSSQVDISRPEATFGSVSISIERFVSNADIFTLDPSVDLALALTGTATLTEDYDISGDIGFEEDDTPLVQFGVGDTVREVIVTVTDDSEVESDEAIEFTLDLDFFSKTAPSKHPVQIAAASAVDVTLTIENDDAAAGPANLTISDLSLSTEISSSVTGIITVTNGGEQAATAISFGALADPLDINNDECGTTLAGGDSCEVEIIYSPGIDDTDTIITDLIASYLQTPSDEEPASASGQITATPIFVTPDPAELNVLPATLTFTGPLQPDSTTQQQFNISLSNVAGVDEQAAFDATLIQFATASENGLFEVVSEDCEATIAAQASDSCLITVSFTAPSSAGLVTDTIPITYFNGVDNDVINITISAEVEAPAEMTPAVLAVTPDTLTLTGPVLTGSDVEQQFIINLSNTAGGAEEPAFAATLIQIDDASTNNLFEIGTAGCVTTLAPLNNNSCLITVNFTAPASAGTVTDTLPISYFNGTSSAVTNITLTADVEAPALIVAELTATPGTLTFADDVESSTTAQQQFTITLSNTSAEEASFDATMIEIGPASLDSQFQVLSEDCSAMLASGASDTCLLTLNFSAPASAGTVTDMLPVSYNNGESTAVTNIQVIAEVSPAPAGIIAFVASQDATIGEDSGTLILNAIRTDGSSGAIAVNLEVTGTATDGTDFQIVSPVADGAGNRTLNWADGTAGIQQITLQPLTDLVVEGDESIQLNLSDATLDGVAQALIGTPDTVQLTITDTTSPGQPTFAASEWNFNESDGTVQVIVNRVGGADGTLQVDYLVNNGTAIAGQDFNDISSPMGSISFASGQTSDAISFSVLSDQIIDPSEQFTITLTNALADNEISVGFGQFPQATVTLLDQTQSSVISLLSNSATVPEGQSATFEVGRTGGDTVFDGPASVQYSITAGGPNPATAGSDFTEVLSGTLEWATGDTSIRQITVDSNNDLSFNETNETVSIVLFNPQPAIANTLGASSSAIVTITDQTNPGSLSITPNVSVSEDSGNAIVTVSRSAPAEGSVVVDFNTADGSATAGVDYSAISMQLNFANGETAKDISIPILPGNDIGDEQFFADLSNPSDGVTIEQSRSTITITDTTDSGTFAWTQNSIDVVEQDATLSLSVIRTGSDGPASVDIVVAAASATQGTDFNLIEPANGTLQWTDGETQKTVQLTIADDNTIEPTESFQLQLTNPSQGAAINPAADQITVDIIDSSDSGQIVFSQDSYQVSEADQSVMIVVERTPSPDGNGNLSGTASVTLSSQSGTAANGPDFDGDLTNSTLSWGDGEGGSRTVQIDIISDDLIEGTESFTVQLSNPAPSQLQLDDPVTVNITDSSIAQPVVLQLPEGNEFQAREGDDSTILIPVSRSGDSQSQVILPLTVGLASDSVSTADFSVSQTQLVWPAGDVSTRFITIDIIDDSVIELTEQLSIQFQPAQAVWPAELIEPPIVPMIQIPATPITLNILDNENRGLLGGDDTPVEPVYALEIVSGDGQSARPPQTLEPLIIQVIDISNTGAIGNVDISWEVISDPQAPNIEVAEFLDTNGSSLGSSTRTISDSTGQSQVVVNVLRRGFIGVRASPTVNITPQAALKRQIRVNPPDFPSRDGDVIFNIRAGLSPTENLTLNQADAARAIDGVCDAIDNAEVTIDPEDAAAVDFATLCDLEDESAPEIRSALDALLAEEIFTWGDASIELADLQVTNVYARINAIRAGQTKRVDTAGLSLRLFGEQIPGSVVDATVQQIRNGGNAGDDLISNWGFFANGAISVGQAEDTQNEVAQEFDTRGITVGADYRIGDTRVVGAALGYTNHEASFAANGGSSTLDGTYLTLFGTWYKPDAGYLDGVFEIGRNRYDISRRINLNLINPVDGSALQGTNIDQFAVGDTSANSLALTLGAGRDFSYKGMLLGSYARLSHTTAEVDAFSERPTNPDAPGIGYVLDVRSHRIRSTRLAFGGQVSKTYSTARGVFVPQFRIEAQYEAEERPDGLSATFRHDPTQTPFTIEGEENDQSVINIGIGSSAVFPNGRNAYLFYEGQLGHNNITQHWLKGGFRIEF